MNDNLPGFTAPTVINTDTNAYLQRSLSTISINNQDIELKGLCADCLKARDDCKSNCDQYRLGKACYTKCDNMYYYCLDRCTVPPPHRL